MIRSLLIESLAHGGDGVGRHRGKAVFVPRTVPGDVVDCRPLQEHRSYVRAEIEVLVEPGGGRRQAPCPVFGECGGCQWQHLAYRHQVDWKVRILEDALRRHGGVADPVLLPPLVSPEEWRYRSRIQLKCRLVEGRPVLGFYRRGSRFVVDIPGCLIAEPRLEQALPALRDHLARSPLAGRIPQVDLEVGTEEEPLRAVFHGLDREPGGLVRDLAPLAASSGWSILVQAGRKESLRRVSGSERLHYRVDDPPLRLGYDAGGFAQVHRRQNRRLVKEVIRLAGLSGRERVLDLYCGNGNISLPLARRAGRLLGIEEYPPAILSARRNADESRVGNAEFLAEPAETAVARLAEAGAGFDLVVLDPPRSGAYRLIKELSRIAPGRILYVSCDPLTLARDLKPLVHGGYRLTCVRPLDLFPQTFHLESVALLERSPDRVSM